MKRIEIKTQGYGKVVAPSHQGRLVAPEDRLVTQLHTLRSIVPTD